MRNLKVPLNAFWDFLFYMVHKPLHQHFRPSMLYSEATNLEKAQQNIRIIIHFGKEVTWYHNCLNCISKPCACDYSFFLFYFSSLNPPMEFFYANLMCNSDRFKFATVPILQRNTKNIICEYPKKCHFWNFVVLYKFKNDTSITFIIQHVVC